MSHAALHSQKDMRKWMESGLICLVTMFSGLFLLFLFLFLSY